MTGMVSSAVLCFRYLNHVPRKVEAAGLVALVIAISFSVVADSNLPTLSGVALLALIQLANRRPTLEAIPVVGVIAWLPRAPKNHFTQRRTVTNIAIEATIRPHAPRSRKIG
jgi:hypothetical protein